MTLELIREVLGWSTLMNFALLLWWFGFFALAHDFVYRLHSKWFNIPVGQFDAIHYGGMAVFKLGVILFNLVPYLALRIVL